MSVIIYGIKNCDTMKKAFAWLDAHGIAYTFVDYKKSGAPAELAAWADAVGWEKLLNRAGTTFKKLPEAAKTDLDRDAALALMRAQPSMIKRPVVSAGGTLLIGFDPARYAALAR